MAAPNMIETYVNPALGLLEETGDAAHRARINKPRWNPQEWHPVYEEVVLLDCLGYKRSEIALEKGFSEHHITEILKTDQARVIRKLVIKRMEATRTETIENRLERLTHKAMDRVEAVINNDTLMDKQPLSIFDRAIVLLKGTSKMRDPDQNGGTNIKNAIIVSDHAMEQLAKGMARADEAKRLHAIPVQGIVEESHAPPEKV